MGKRVTAPSLRTMRAEGNRIVCVTAYDSTFGALADEAGVGLFEMAHHVRAVRAGVSQALLVADLPFGSYGASVGQAVESAAALMKAGAEAVKLEGDYPEEVRACVRAGIPVMGHLGFTPQSVHVFGGHKVQGKGDAGEATIAVAHRLADAGVFATVLELVPATLAARITKEVEMPTIGIGAGRGCDGQIQVLHDVLGFSGRAYRHAKPFLNGRHLIVDALSRYTDEVRRDVFPTEANAV